MENLTEEQDEQIKKRIAKEIMVRICIGLLFGFMWGTTIFAIGMAQVQIYHSQFISGCLGFVVGIVGIKMYRSAVNERRELFNKDIHSIIDNK